MPPRSRSRAALPCLLALGACASAGDVPRELAALLATAPPGAPMRLWLDGDRVVAVAVPDAPGLLPHDARIAVEATAPGGELRFQGREWGARGHGFRVDKHYGGAAVEHERSVLVAADGSVLERDHTVPVAEVPQHVLAGALTAGVTVAEARIVSGPEREEYWRVVVLDRTGRSFVVTVELDGRVRGVVRRIEARVDA